MGFPIFGTNGKGEIFWCQANLFKRSLAGLNAMNKKSEVFLNFAKLQQENRFELYKTQVACLRKVADACREGGLVQVVNTCLESMEGMVAAVASAVTKGSGACTDLFQSCLSGERQPANVQKEMAA